MSQATNAPLDPATKERLAAAICRLGSAEAAVAALEVSEKPLMRAAVGLPVRRMTRGAIVAALARHEAIQASDG
jgi:hypothetical protein